MSACERLSAVRRMHPLSGEFERSFEVFTDLVANCNNDIDVRIFNMSLVANYVAYIENLLNEKLEAHETQKAFLKKAPLKNIHDIPSPNKKIDFRKKWNKVQLTKPTPNKWDNGNSVFSDFAALRSLRNEIFHYKCDFLQAGEIPKEDIERIMYQVCDEQPYSEKPYNKQMFQSWCQYLLSQKKLSEWCMTTTKNLKELL